ncbi:DUF6624 domain-containing protein [Pirellulaceae bacterium SH449]
MKKISCCLIVLCLLAACNVALAQEAPRPTITEPELRKELLQRAEQDQAIRQELIKAGMESLDQNILAKMQATDKANTERMKTIIAKHGWPTSGLVGDDGVQAAFLLLQHADHEFQKAVLPKVEIAFKENKIPGQNYALLLDRVRVGDGKPQVYGTQAKDIAEWKGREPVFEPIEDEGNVDKRREQVGLPPLSVYRKLLKDVYFPEAK